MNKKWNADIKYKNIETKVTGGCLFISRLNKVCRK